MGALESVIATAMTLRGHKHAPELPIPFGDILVYAQARGYSPAFAHLVRTYEETVIRILNEGLKKSQAKMQREIANGGKLPGQHRTVARGTR